MYKYTNLNNKYYNEIMIAIIKSDITKRRNQYANTNNNIITSKYLIITQNQYKSYR